MFHIIFFDEYEVKSAVRESEAYRRHMYNNIVSVSEAINWITNIVISILQRMFTVCDTC